MTKDSLIEQSRLSWVALMDLWTETGVGFHVEPRSDVGSVGFEHHKNDNVEIGPRELQQHKRSNAEGFTLELLAHRSTSALRQK
ncbi:hypothetical protein ANCCAN_00376 [Ancylostoma caninum]|uniref:Uncharacterized protein n=1 Tax=Ancylostoma caninum TaxID=29170 RepID=A0A368H9Q0_ANCCA|nr:hypothetical protein ANCCAN_00376 [Ancylostoma caninum]